MNLATKADLAAISTKEIITLNEAAQYLGMSKSYLYKLTSNGAIPHYKPFGKMVYFNRPELEQWLQRNRIVIESKPITQTQPKFKHHESRY